MHFIQQLRWRPEIGDPSSMGWFTVAAYALAAVLCWLAARRVRRAPGTTRGSYGMWIGVTVLMLFLCLNKQLDLQSLLTDIGRIIARKQGWYADRREFQKWIVIGLITISALSGLSLVWFLRDFWKRHPLLIIGLLFTTTFILTRAVSFHHMEVLLHHRIGDIKVNWILELTGITMIGIAALLEYYNPRKPHPAAWKSAA